MCFSHIHDDRKLYIVYMGAIPRKDNYSPTSHHLNILQKIADSENANQFLARSYKRSFNGFAAWLTDKERQNMADLEEVVSIIPNVNLKPRTTESWDFLGFPENVNRFLLAETTITIGVLDFGIWPESDSFSDKGLSPPPEYFRDACRGGTDFICNNKIVGARYYNSSTTARDQNGHGTHTASIAAGNAVPGVTFDSIQGTARGGVPSARIAAYRICGEKECPTADMLAGFDDAIADGVDIITISIGYDDPLDFVDDAIALGSFHALKKDVLTVHCAGNGGPDVKTMESFAPWLLTVGATGTRRNFVDPVTLGDGRKLTNRMGASRRSRSGPVRVGSVQIESVWFGQFGSVPVGSVWFETGWFDSICNRSVRTEPNPSERRGVAINTFETTASVPLAYGAGNPNCEDNDRRVCKPQCLDETLRGKIVMCDQPPSYDDLNRVGAAGLALLVPTNDTSHVSGLPEADFTGSGYALLQEYAATQDPRITIEKSSTVVDEASPYVASFSSRGPNSFMPYIMKPDVVAPGRHILAAWPPNIPPTSTGSDKRSVNYNIMSGTSMATPHVAGAAAYVLSFNPQWSPSAIKSALMTTEFAYGSGLIDPVKAIDPGLVYDNNYADHVKLLCVYYNDRKKVRLITGEPNPCSIEFLSPLNYNYPIIAQAIDVSKSTAIDLSFRRVLKNVEFNASMYTAKVDADPHVKIQVTPDSFVFEKVRDTRLFTVRVTGIYPSDALLLSSTLVWSDGTHSVRTPIVIYKS
uniref:Uncharacterized protein n=1 Tax=Kalanchoe fedtschenkoi TaxID=63787 RepID=A0A7N0UJC2_KALFE